jgi:ribosomal protein L32E
MLGAPFLIRNRRNVLRKENKRYRRDAWRDQHGRKNVLFDLVKENRQLFSEKYRTRAELLTGSAADEECYG